MATKSKHQPLWAAFVNQNGLITPKPIRLYWHKEISSYGEDYYVDKSGTYSVIGPGLNNCSNDTRIRTCIASTVQFDIQLFIEGAKAMNKILANMVKDIV